jgi:hypothetical protein
VRCGMCWATKLDGTNAAAPVYRRKKIHLYAFFATGYYSTARPDEDLALREDDCKLTEDRWTS